ncbi:MAG: hypothetical protein HYX72_06020 [Acidobacteria bacterium]|nr:hypothetical protein [Acidobacteriota bacterium]
MELLTVAVIAGIIGFVLYDQHRKDQTHQVISHVAEKLYVDLLRPIEESAYNKPDLDTDAKTVLVLSDEAFKGLIAYVRLARSLLSALGTDRWGNAFKDGDFRFQVVAAANREFFRRRDDETDFEVAFDPFAVWAQRLHHCALFENLNLDEIVEVQICPHREIAFKTTEKLFNATEAGTFPCRECITPSHVFRVMDRS